MVHTNNPIIKHKAGLLNLAEELGNVSKACKIMGVSRDTFYRYQELVDSGADKTEAEKQMRSIVKEYMINENIKRKGKDPYDEKKKLFKDV